MFWLIPTFWYKEKRLWITTMKEYEIEWPFEFESKFTKADLILTSRESVDGYLQGKCFYAFNIPGLHCRLVIYPNGYNINQRGQTWIFLQINASKERKIAAEFKISVESANYLSESINIVYENFVGYGANICKIGKFFDRKNKYFTDEEITIKVKGILKAKRPTVSTIARPISLQWKIKEDDLKKAMAPDSRNILRSTMFNTTASIDDLRYYFLIYLNKFDARENKVGVCAYLCVKLGDEMETKAFFDFSIESASFRRSYEYVYKKTEGYGDYICSTEDLFDPSKRYIIDGYLTINYTGVLMVERNRLMTLKSKNFLAPILVQRNPKDFVIVVGDKQIPVHKQLLMDVSPVWAGMIESGMKETTENKMVIKDFSFKIIEAAVKVFYNQNGICSLTMEEMFMLYKFANKYFIEFLLDLVERALIKMISPSNVCHLIQLSAPESFNILKLHESCILFLGKCFKESIPVYGAESLGDKFLAAVFLRGFHPISDSVTHL